MTDLHRIADEAGIRVEYCRIPLNESLSVEDADGDFVLMDYGLINTGAAERTHLAHEIGHCVQGAFYNPYATLDVREKHEKRADKWAIEALIPADDLEQAIADGYTEIWSLAEHFNVTEDFMKKAVCWHLHGTLETELYFLPGNC